MATVGHLEYAGRIRATTHFYNLFYYRHLAYIVYFRHLAILNYCLALGLPPNIIEFQIELKIPVIYLVCPSPLPVV